MKSNKKDDEIKLRVTTQEKEKIKKLLAPSQTMSAYILEKALTTDSDRHKSIIEKVDALDLLNTVMLEVEKSTDEPLKNQIRNIMTGRMRNEW